MVTKLQLVKDLVRGLIHDAAEPRFTNYSNTEFTLRRGRSFGVETVLLQYKGRGMSLEIEGEEGTDGGMSIQLDRTTALDRLDDLAKVQLAADIHTAMQSQHIPCQILQGHRVL
jgi:hypothetical protein